MSRIVIHTNQAPAAIGPYSQAVRAGNTLYCSGQICLKPDGELLEGADVADQAEQCLKNLGQVLAAAGLEYAHVAKTTIFLSSMAHFALVNEVYRRFFPSDAPARSTVAVAGLPRGVDVEIEAIAVYPESTTPA